MERGAFYFRNEGDGCIAGKYFNDGSKRIFTESCIRLSLDHDHPEDIFCGNYYSTWIEENGKSEKAQLTISRKPDAIGIYLLKWLGKKDHLLFGGEAMLADGLLTGCYYELRQ